MKKISILSFLIFFIASLSFAIPLFSGTIDSVDFKKGIILIDGKSYEFDEDCMVDDPGASENEEPSLLSLKPGKKVTFRLKTLNEFERRVMSFIIEP